MKLSLLVIIKDLSIWIVFFMISTAQGVTDMTPIGMLIGALYINFIPILIDIAVVHLIHRYIKYKRHPSFIQLFKIGALLHVPILIFWELGPLIGYTKNNIAFQIGLITSVVVTGLTWYLLNSEKE